MEIPDSSLLDLAAKVRAWIPWRSDLSGVSREFWMPNTSCRMCYECHSQFTVFKGRHYCRSCGRVFCRGCMHNSVSAVLDDCRISAGDRVQIRLCKFCFQSIGREVVAEYDQKKELFVIPREKFALSLSLGSEKFSSYTVDCSLHSAQIGVNQQIIKLLDSDPLACFLEDQMASQVNSRVASSADQLSLFSPCCSAGRSYEEDAEDSAKNHLSPLSEFYQDISDVDASSTYTRSEFYSFKSVSSSPMNSPSMMTDSTDRVNFPLPSDQGESPRSPDDVFVEQEPVEILRRPETEIEDFENADTDNLSIFQCQTQKAEHPLDFETNSFIWFPPPPEDEEDDMENSIFEYDDEDDIVGDSGLIFSSSSFSAKAFHDKDRSSEEHKEPLRLVVHGHFRALVSQLLKGEGIDAGLEDEKECWLETVASLAWQAATFVKPDTSRGSSMDPSDYVKVKCVASGNPRESAFIKGVVCTKNIKHKRMTSQYRNPRLLLLGGALEYQRVPNKLASIETLLQQEMDHLKMTVAKIEAYHPNVLLVEKSVSSYAQEYLLAKEISLVLNVKRPLLERIARCTGAQIVPSIDNLSSPRLGQCEIFRLERVTEESTSADQPHKKIAKTLMFFEGCPRRLGCTVLLRGACREELKKLKHVVQYAVFAAYHLSLETSFLADEGATLPKLPLKPPIAIPGKLMSADRAISTVPQSAIPVTCKAIAGETQSLGASHMLTPKCIRSPSELLAKNEGSLGFNAELEESESSYEHLSPDLVYALSFGFLDDAIGDACSIVSADSVTDRALGSSFGNLHSKAPVHVRTYSHFPTTKPGGHENAVQEEEGILGNQSPGSDHGKRTKRDMVERNVDPKDYFSPSDNHQSILVSLSSHCVLKGTICERSQLIRIKFYGSFDKPLGRYLRDDLFDQTSSCRYCKEPAEAHVRCYTQQQGSLTISVRCLSSLKLPGERDGKIWMWHRCLKCAHKDGVPPATRRVVMSDAAWGLSFGKFLELSFSNHATANRVASCGHSLQRDCLRYYGFGCMVAFFRYSPIDILSVHLPPAVLEFNDKIQHEWARREAADVSDKMEFLYAEVFDALHSIEQKIATPGTGYEFTKMNDLQSHIVELKELLKKERSEYDGLLPLATIDNFQPGQMGVDVLDLNHLRRCLLTDSYVWDRRLCLLDSFLKTKGPITMIDPFVNKDDATIIKLKEGTKREIFCKDPLMSKQLGELDLQLCSPNPSGLVQMVAPIKTTRSFVGSENLELESNHNQGPEERPLGGEIPTERTSLERLSSFESNLSEKIDSAWIGEGQSARAPVFHVVPSDGEDTGSVGRTNPMTDHLSHRKIMCPSRVYSFDSALKNRVRSQKGLSLATSHLSPARSFHACGDFGSFVRDPIPNVLRSCSRTSPRAIQRLVFNYSPSFISSTSSLLSEGARLLLPPTGRCNIAIAVYENEPTSIIAYALSSRDYEDSMCDKLDEGESWKGISTGPARHSINSLDSDDFQCRSYGSDETSSSRGILGYSDPKKPLHVRVSFSDKSSLSGKVMFSVTCYFAKQFDALRNKCCPSELDFIRSLSRCRRWSAQGGKSNVYFAKSLDERFILKQITKTEFDSFEEFSPEYFKYLSDSLSSGSPTCLAKVLGIYQVTVKHLKGGREVKMDLMVMENLFYGRNLSRVYDLKGSTRSRYNPDTSGSNKVLLDLNLLEVLRTKPIFLGSKAKRSLERAVWNDTSFLASVDVMDYSLLVGVDEEQKELVLGIIDFMRQYTWDKHLETWVKASGILGGPKNVSPTVISPKQYKKRFRKAMSTYFLTVPDQWSS